MKINMRKICSIYLHIYNAINTLSFIFNLAFVIIIIYIINEC